MRHLGPWTMFRLSASKVLVRINKKDGVQYRRILFRRVQLWLITPHYITHPFLTPPPLHYILLLVCTEG